MNKNQIKGRVKETESQAKKVTGKILDNESIELQRNLQTDIGKAKSQIGSLKEYFEKGWC